MNEGTKIPSVTITPPGKKAAAPHKTLGVRADSFEAHGIGCDAILQEDFTNNRSGRKAGRASRACVADSQPAGAGYHLGGSPLWFDGKYANGLRPALEAARLSNSLRNNKAREQGAHGLLCFCRDYAVSAIRQRTESACQLMLWVKAGSGWCSRSRCGWDKSCRRSDRIAIRKRRYRRSLLAAFQLGWRCR